MGASPFPRTEGILPSKGLAPEAGDLNPPRRPRALCLRTQSSILNRRRAGPYIRTVDSLVDRFTLNRSCSASRLRRKTAEGRMPSLQKKKAAMLPAICPYPVFSTPEEGWAQAHSPGPRASCPRKVSRRRRETLTPLAGRGHSAFAPNPPSSTDAGPAHTSAPSTRSSIALHSTAVVQPPAFGGRLPRAGCPRSKGKKPPCFRRFAGARC